MIENAMKIARSKMTNLIIRVPVIPGFNDTEAEILDIARYADSLSGVEKIHLLPYHSYGEGKYMGLGREYPMGTVKSPSDEKMEQLREMVANNTSLNCVVGG